TKVTATSGSTAVMFVEVYYSYTGLVGQMFVSNRVLRKEGAFLIRDERNLTPGVTGTGARHSCA
ncbi:MAG: pilus assembly protein TadE, partial [Novosphingobium sp.]|nr:pilus assembly protein TadE [Novosphingobium sp.]